jgi:hypothetical protein
MSETLASFSIDELRHEIARRDAPAADARWEAMKTRAKSLCSTCGGPDSWHTRDCPTDTDCT